MLEASHAALKTHEIPTNQALPHFVYVEWNGEIVVFPSGTLHEPARKSGKNPGSDVPVMFEGE